MKKNILIGVLILLVAGLIFYFGFNKKETKQMENTIPGLKIEVLKEGNEAGNVTQNGNTVTVNYLGKFENGTQFDSSYDRGLPFSFILGAGQVIRGWDLGVLGMKVGEKRRLTIDSSLAYGDAGVPGAIPPKSTLIFEVELLEIK
jgi:peptidylprolyl isomerase